MNLNEGEKYYRELAEKYENLNLMLEKQLQEEIIKNKEKDQILIQHSRLAAMGEMVANISHQWRQPLNNLTLLLQDVKEALEFGEIDDQYIDQFTSEGMVIIKNMAQTINDFRRFYKPNKEKSAFSVGDAIEEALSIFSISLKKHSIQVEFTFGGQQIAFGYPNEFGLVVLNILTNARDAFVANTVKNRKLIIKIEESDKFITAEFIDNAGGIKPPLIQKVFDPYFTTKLQGTGFGLYMTKMIIENMNGIVSVENSGDGAKFCLSVPKVTADVKEGILAETVI